MFKLVERIRSQKDFAIFVVLVLVFAAVALKLAGPLKHWIDLNGFDSAQEIHWVMFIFGCEMGAALWVSTIWESRSRKQ